MPIMSIGSSIPKACLFGGIVLAECLTASAWAPHDSTNDWNVASGNASVAANYKDGGTGLTCENPPGADTLVRISNSGEMTITSDLSWGALWVGDTGNGTVRHESGTLTVNNPASYPSMDHIFSIGYGTGKLGCYYMSGGRVTCTAGNAKIGCRGYGLFDIAGGEFYATRFPTVGLFQGGSGHLVVHGTGVFNTTSAAQTLIGEHGQGVVTVYGGGKVQTGVLTFGSATTATGMVNVLTGGEFSPASINAGNSATKRINGLGGTVKPRMTVDLVDGYLAGAQMSVGAGGLAFDTNGKVVTLAPSLGQTRLLTRNLAHRWSFNGDATDSVGSMDAVLTGENKANITYDNGEICLSGRSDLNGKEYIALGAGCIPSGKDGITIEMWTTHEAYHPWSRIFTCSSADGSSMMYTAWAGNSGPNLDFTHFTVAGTQKTHGGQFFCPWVTGVKYHFTFVFEKRSSDWRVDVCKRDALTGAPMGRLTTTAALEWDPASLAGSYFNLGYSHVAADPSACARFDEVRIWNIALTEDELVESTTRGPDADFTTAPCLRKTGEGTLTLASASTYDGETKVEAGTLALRAPVMPVQRWSFENGSLTNGITGSVASLAGTEASGIAFTADGKGIETPGATHGKAIVHLGQNRIPTNSVGFAIEIWATLREARANSRIFSASISDNTIFMSWCQGTDNTKDWAGIQYNGTDRLTWSQMSPYEIGQPYHLVSVVEPLQAGGYALRFYKQNATTCALEKKYGYALPDGWTPEILANSSFALAWSPFSSDDDAHARYDEVRVWNRPLTEAEVIASGNLGPDELPKFWFSDAPAGALPAATTLRVDAGAEFLLGGASQTVSNLVCNGTLEGPGTLTVTEAIRPGGASSVGALAVKTGVKLVGTVELDLLANGTGDSIDFASGDTFDISDIHWTIADPTTVAASRFYTIANAAGATLTGEPDVSGLPSSFAIEERNGNLVLHRITGATIFIR